MSDLEEVETLFFVLVGGSWEHSIAAMEVTRWSITFRSLSKRGRLQAMQT